MGASKMQQFMSLCLDHLLHRRHLRRLLRQLQSTAKIWKVHAAFGNREGIVRAVHGFTRSCHTIAGKLVISVVPAAKTRSTFVHLGLEWDIVPLRGTRHTWKQIARSLATF